MLPGRAKRAGSAFSVIPSLSKDQTHVAGKSTELPRERPLREPPKRIPLIPSPPVIPSKKPPSSRACRRISSVFLQPSFCSRRREAVAEPRGRFATKIRPPGLVESCPLGTGKMESPKAIPAGARVRGSESSQRSDASLAPKDATVTREPAKTSVILSEASRRSRRISPRWAPQLTLPFRPRHPSS